MNKPEECEKRKNRCHNVMPEIKASRLRGATRIDKIQSSGVHFISRDPHDSKVKTHARIVSTSHNVLQPFFCAS